MQSRTTSVTTCRNKIGNSWWNWKRDLKFYEILKIKKWLEIKHRHYRYGYGHLWIRPSGINYGHMWFWKGNGSKCLFCKAYKEGLLSVIGRPLRTICYFKEKMKRWVVSWIILWSREVILYESNWKKPVFEGLGSHTVKSLMLALPREVTDV